MKLQIAITPNTQARTTLSLSGRLDSHTSPELERTFQETPFGHGAEMVLDLSRLQYISSAGLRILLKQKNALVAKGGRLLLVNPQPQVRKVFDIIKALPAQTIFVSVQEMDEYLETVQRKVSEQN